MSKRGVWPNFSARFLKIGIRQYFDSVGVRVFYYRETGAGPKYFGVSGSISVFEIAFQSLDHSLKHSVNPEAESNQSDAQDGKRAPVLFTGSSYRVT
ncbi:MAG: hypothetical protein ACREE6_18615, partial [Limisphaerales bacterium]